MILYLSTKTEWNSGLLLSLAVVGDGKEWYQVADIEEHTPRSEWARVTLQTVAPVLQKEPISGGEFVVSLDDFFHEIDNYPLIIANDSVSLAHLVSFMDDLHATPGGLRGRYFEMQLDPTPVDYLLLASTPHNALAEARALKKLYSGWPLSKRDKFIVESAA